MGWLTSFTITVLCVVLITSIMSAIMPEGNLQKFVHLILGIIVMITIVSAAIGITKIDFDNVFALDTTSTLNKENAALEYNKQVVLHFEARLSADIVAFIKRNYNVDAAVVAKACVNQNNTVTGIESIEIQLPAWADATAIRKDIAKTYGVDIKDVLVGGTGQ